MKQRTLRARWLAAAAGIILLAAPAQAGATKDFTIGAALIAINLVYVPAKLVYAAAGGLVAGAAYAVSGGDAAVADPIVAAAVGGDYIVEQAHLRRQKPIEFVGRLEAHEVARDVASGTPGRGRPADQGEDAGF